MVFFDNPPRDGQSQPCPALLGGGKGLEQPRQQLGGEFPHLYPLICTPTSPSSGSLTRFTARLPPSGIASIPLISRLTNTWWSNCHRCLPQWLDPQRNLRLDALLCQALDQMHRPLDRFPQVVQLTLRLCRRESPAVLESWFPSGRSRRGLMRPAGRLPPHRRGWQHAAAGSLTEVSGLRS